MAAAAPRLDAAGPDYVRELAEVKRLASLLDTRWRMPIIGVRFGIDPLLGLLPVAGSVTAGAISTYIMVKAHRLGAPAGLLTKMAGNIAIDTVVGSVPVLGSIFDIYYKSSTRNLRLLQDHLEERSKI